MLTATDDSSVVHGEANSAVEKNILAKIELLDQWIYEGEQEVAEYGATKIELHEQLDKLEEFISSQRGMLSVFQTQLNDSVLTRRQVVIEREEIYYRLDEIADLLERFALLSHHYSVDINRLIAIEESGSLFVHHDRITCPLCGSSPTEHHIDDACDGDVDSIVSAASAEIKKIESLTQDLQSTISSLSVETLRLNQQLVDVETNFKRIDKSIVEAVAPSLVDQQEKFSDSIELKNNISSALNAFSKLDKLFLQKKELLGDDADEEVEDVVKTEIPKYTLNRFSQTVQNILEAWDFPGYGTVYFDEVAKDFVINGKPRGSRGKGLRAITHAAVTLGLLEFCKENLLPHPGFVVLDSPLLGYYKPEGAEDNLQGTDLKQKFYQYLIDKHSDSQVIIIENEHPPQIFDDLINLTVFTRNPQDGRYGLFPVKEVDQSMP